jgi:hypothetical protein
MQDLYKGFKKVDEDDSRAVLKHENGHELVIAKSGISKKQRKALDKLPVYQAQGTPIEEQAKMPVPELDAGNALKNVGAQITEAVAKKVVEGAEESIPSARMPASVTPEELAGLRQYQQEQQQPVAPRPEGTTPPGLSSYGTPQEEMSKATPQMASGFGRQILEQPPTEMATQPPMVSEEMPVDMAAREAAAVSQEEALAPAMPPVPRPKVTKSLEEIVADPNAPMSERLEAQNAMYLKNLSDLQQSRTRETEILNKMEPKRVFNDASLGNKMLMVISAIAGGIGAGLTGRENAALKAMDDAFNRDWEAQKEDRSNRLNLHKLHMESLKDEMASRLQVMANFKNIMAAKMEEAERKYGMGSLAQQRLQAERLKIENEIQGYYQQIADRKTTEQIKSALQAPAPEGQLVSQDPTSFLKQLVPDEKLRPLVSKEISRRKAIVKSAPEIINTLKRVFDDYGSFKGQTIGRIKEPESVKDLETEIRGIIPEQAGDVTGQARETQVQALLRLLKPGPGDVFDKTQYSERLSKWLQQNIETPAATESGIDLNKFSQTSIRPETWGAGAEIERLDPRSGRIVVYDAKTKKPLRYK